MLRVFAGQLVIGPQQGNASAGGVRMHAAIAGNHQFFVVSTPICPW